ncbi:TPA: V-type ATP synthase subunit I [Streptococcus pneumoniae]
MAISQMKRISLLFSKSSLDDVLKTIQELESVQFRDLKVQDNWSEALEKDEVVFPTIQIFHTSNSNHGVIEGNDALTYLMNQQQHLEATVEKLQEYLPKENTFKLLQQPPITTSYEELEKFGKANVAEGVLKKVNHQINRVHELERHIQSNNEEIERLIKWEKLEIVPANLEQFSFCKGKVGTIPRTEDNRLYNSLLENNIEVQEIFSNDREYGVVVFYQSSYSIDFDEYLFEPFDYSRKELPKQRVVDLDQENMQLITEKENIIASLQDSKKYLIDLQWQIDYILSIYARQISKNNFLCTPHLVALEGWIEETRILYFIKVMDEHFGHSIYIYESETLTDNQDEIPIKLTNHSLIEPFELLTEMYALPKYYEKDPTPVLAPFYFTFFGMMVADLGYGLLLFFGYELPFHLISTTSDVMTILVVSVVFGFITVFAGLLASGLQKVRMKKYAEAYNSGFAWCVILLGLLFIAVGMLMPDMRPLFVLGKWVSIFNAVGILIVSIIQTKSLSGIGAGLFNLYNISSYIGDLVSFTRLMALGLSGASIASAFNLIVGLFPGILAKLTIGLVLFILLHAINIFLSLLSGYVHGARLIFVEFFGKFYEGGGKPFQPLKASEKYIKVITKN